MKNYFHFDFMFFPHEFLLNRATVTYLNLVLKLHQLMQSRSDHREKLTTDAKEAGVDNVTASETLK